jgi:hypothetical protein
VPCPGLAGTGTPGLLFMPALVVAIIFVVLDWKHPIQSLEGQLYDQLFAVAVLVVLFLLLCALTAMALTWLRLRACL